MKKQFLFAIAVTMLTACVNTDTFKDINAPQGSENDGSIYFESFTSKQTKAENSKANYSWAFYEYQPDFLVWGYKDNANDPVFKGDATNDKVTAARSGDGTNDSPYVYSFGNTALLRFWDKSPLRKYQFYAAAPATLPGSETWSFTAPSNADKSDGYFTTTSTLTGVNLQASSPSATLVNTFKNLADCDKLIAAPCSGNYTNFSVAVQLHFIHILSKMNVTVRKDASLAGANYTVKLKKIEVKGLKATGTFTEGAEAYTAASTGSNTRWSSTSGSVTYTYQNNDGVTLSAEAAASDRVCFIESLVIPQTAETQNIDFDGKILSSTPYADVDEYNTAHKLTGTAALSADQFNELTANAKLKPVVYETASAYDAGKGNPENTTTTDAFTGLTTEEKAKYVFDVNSGAQPYFEIQYTILYNGNSNPEPFTSYYNLASAVMGTSSVDFFEGYQNTFNITIKPDAIEFTADVAAWDEAYPANANDANDIPGKEYDIE